MLHFPFWKKFLIVGIAVLGVFYAIPNAFYWPVKDARETVKEIVEVHKHKPTQALIDKANSWPTFLPREVVNLGLDLQGGIHVLIEPQIDVVLERRMQTLSRDMRLAMREQEIKRYSRPRVSGDTVAMTITNPADLDKAETALRRLAQPVVSGALGATGAVDLQLTREGNRLALTMTEAAKAAARTKLIEQSVEVLRKRVDPQGTTEASIQRNGRDRILIQIPGVSEIDQDIFQPAALSFHIVQKSISPFSIPELDANGDTVVDGDEDAIVLEEQPEDGGPVAVAWQLDRVPLITGEQVLDAAPGFDGQTSEPIVSFRFNSTAAKIFADWTRKNVGQPFAIVVDGKVLSAPVVREPILGGSGQISGNFDAASANQLAVNISSGALPADLVIKSQSAIGPELGADSIASGKMAALIGFAAVIAFMILVYGTWGFFANIALGVNVALIFAIMAQLGATLTLPGIAGIVLTIGMAVDANVLIFERIREEILSGKSPSKAIEAGYERALTAIIDANITTFIAAAILYMFGSGPVKGFAVTLGVGIITSVFTAVFLTRYMVATWYDWKRPKKLKVGLLRLIKPGTKIGFTRQRGIAGLFSILAIVGALGLYAVKGLNYGIDFQGGVMLETRTMDGDEKGVADLATIRSTLSALDLGDISVQEFGEPSDTLVRLESPGDDKAQTALINTTKAALQEKIEGLRVMRVESVGPEVSGELVVAGITAVLLAIAAVLFYIWLRFEWQFSLGAVTALAHDVALTIGIFSLIGLEFNLSIIAAILTIVGYSLNDTVVVYDRIRENLRKYKTMDLSDLIDLSLNETLSRTIMTSVTTLIALLALYFLGGEVIRGFTFAMIWGVVVGTYSSIFIAAPILMRFGVKRDWSRETGDGPSGVRFGNAP